MIFLYIILNVILIYYRIKPYDYNLSSMIGIWEGFLNLNPDFVDKGFVVYKSGGYDGQFFYLINQYLSGVSSQLPILDSFSVRFTRIGLPLLTSIFSKIFGTKAYPVITLAILHLSHIMSFVMLKKLCKKEIRYLANFHLFSPFVINSNLLLLSDSLVCSWTIFIFYFLNQKDCHKPAKISVLLLLGCFFVLIKESALSIMGMLLLLLWLKRSYPPNSFSSSSVQILPPTGGSNETKSLLGLVGGSIIFYFAFVFYLRFFLDANPGTYPLTFLDLIDYPFFGFFKSISFSTPMNLSPFVRELAKYPIFIFYLLLLLNLRNIKTVQDFVWFLPILFILFTAGIAEQGYWLTYDNIMRMFTLSIPMIILYKNSKKSYNDFGILWFGIVLLAMLIVRILWLKKEMEFFFN
ncbi:MAG: hypothetical protein H7A23_19570 [Leptospiraceae bacterium]|nr:hypothetical protein [Leptospiraceae bacterium]